MWKSDKRWSEDASRILKPVEASREEKIMRCEGGLALFCAGNEFGLRDLETGEELCRRSPHVQVVQELYEHTWRRRYAGDVSKGFK